MPTIFPTYEINEQTLALKPAFHHEYSTIALEGDQKKLYIRKTPLQLIQQAALKGGSDYNGRRKSIIYLTGIKKKIPIPLYPHKNIYTFPTHSPNHKDCHWIFFQHVESFQKLLDPTNSIKFLFKNGLFFRSFNDSSCILLKTIASHNASSVICGSSLKSAIVRASRRILICTRLLHFFFNVICCKALGGQAPELPVISQ